jgi:uncharacterized protein (DUF342 family)
MTVRITEDGMEAYLMLSPISENERYDMGQLVQFLNSHKVVYGIDEAALKRMVEIPILRHEVCVAHGKKPIDGKDGELTYKFDTNMNSKPKIRPDGSVDYWSIHSVEMVEEGQVIAIYTEPTSSENGMTVSAKPLLAKRGKPLPPLRGKGFSCAEDGRTYVADLAGKIELVNGGIRISQVYEISGDVGLATGNIDFHGDVVIHGNVTPGASVKATGSITVDGTCENCMLEARKDIILRGGVLGGEKTNIRSGGNIHAKFFEYCQVQAEGYIDAESALGSRMISYDRIFLAGKKANLVGGYAYATSGLEVNTIGNSSEVKTSIHVGVSTDILKELVDAQKQQKDAEDMIKKITQGLEEYDELAAEHGIDVSKDMRRVALLRTRMIKQAEVASLKKEIDHLNEVVERSKGASVTVLHDVFAGTTVTINQSKNIVKEQQSAVRFVLRENNVIMLSVADELV